MSSNETKNTPESRKPKILASALVVAIAIAVIIGSSVVLLRSKKDAGTQTEPGNTAATTPIINEKSVTPDATAVTGATAVSALAKGALHTALLPSLPTGQTTSALGVAANKTPGSIEAIEQTPPAPLLPAAPLDGCVTIAYHHKKMQGHSSEESCLNHKNLLKLKHPNANSICVRVNKTPLAFEKVAGKIDEIILAPGAGPHAEISVRYCFGKKTCPEDCTIPKDEFMGSIGASARNEKDDGGAQWDPSEKTDPSKAKLNIHAKIDSDLKKDLETLDEPDSAAPTTFKEWIAEGANPACGIKQAVR